MIVLWYSIEQSKQRSEEDRLLILAEEKKASVRQTIKNMREDFEKLIRRNFDIPPYRRLHRKVCLSVCLICVVCILTLIHPLLIEEGTVRMVFKLEFYLCLTVVLSAITKLVYKTIII